jgi:hypothetical protein
MGAGPAPKPRQGRCHLIAHGFSRGETGSQHLGEPWNGRYDYHRPLSRCPICSNDLFAKPSWNRPFQGGIRNGTLTHGLKPWAMSWSRPCRGSDSQRNRFLDTFERCWPAGYKALNWRRRALTPDRRRWSPPFRRPCRARGWERWLPRVPPSALPWAIVRRRFAAGSGSRAALVGPDGDLYQRRGSTLTRWFPSNACGYRRRPLHQHPSTPVFNAPRRFPSGAAVWCCPLPLNPCPSMWCGGRDYGKSAKVFSIRRTT